MTTTELELALMKHFDFRKNIIVPNVTKISQLVKFETDLLVLSKANFAHGIELKVSLSDFKKEVNKTHIKRARGIPDLGYWDYDFDFYFKPLKHFSYAFPEELLDYACKNVDERFGLYKVRQMSYKQEKWLNVCEVRKPKVLFKTKWTDKEVKHLMHLGCMRIYNLKTKI